MEGDELYRFYRQKLRHGDDRERREVMEWAQEAYEFDHKISQHQYELLVQLYATLTAPSLSGQ